MPKDIDPETMNVDKMPAIWSPVQWELEEEERIQELHTQATASLLWVADIPEALLRLLLNEAEIERSFSPPEGYDPEMQGEWDENLVTFKFKRQLELVKIERQHDDLYVEYKFEDLGYFGVEISPDQATVFRL